MDKIAIINSLSFKRKKPSIQKELIHKINGLPETKIAFTENAAGARQICRESQKYQLIIAAGGDGTIYEIINAMDLENQKLALIPLGTGNSLCRDLRINSINEAIQRIKSGGTQRIDLINCRFRINRTSSQCYVAATASVGYITKMIIFAQPPLKNAAESMLSPGDFSLFIKTEKNQMRNFY